MNLNSQNKAKSLSIILPCFNPAKGWEYRIKDSITKLQALDASLELEVVFVNDGSPNSLAEGLRFLKENIKNFIYLEYIENKGKGFAVRLGATKCNSACIIYTDIDFPYLEENLYDFYLSVINQESDLVIGIRSENYYTEISNSRRKISLWYKKLIKTALRIPTSDTQAGLKALSRKGLNSLLACKTNGYLFDLELIKRASKANLKITQLGIQAKKDLVLSRMPFKVLLKELLNFVKIAVIY